MEQEKYRLIADYTLIKGQVAPCLIPPCPSFGDVKLLKGEVISGTPISVLGFMQLKGTITGQQPPRGGVMPSPNVVGILYYKTIGGDATSKVAATPFLVPFSVLEKVSEQNSVQKAVGTTTNQPAKSKIFTTKNVVIGLLVITAIFVAYKLKLHKQLS